MSIPNLIQIGASLNKNLSINDISNLENVQEGDEVIVFDDEMTISNLAKRINTIPYEILTSISERVKRIFFTE